MIFPISHDDHQARRTPVVTIGILALCALLHLFFVVTGGIDRGVDRIEATGTVALEYLGDRPYLTPPRELAAWLSEGMSRDEKQMLSDGRAKGPPPDADVEREQAELDALARDFQSAVDAAPLFRFGYVPRLGSALGLFTNMFLHAGWLHLIGNLWMLWLCGCNLEDRWGRPVFAGAYLLSGVAATLLHGALHPQSFVPLVGASGALAGAMGGFLVLYARTNIRFAYVFGLGFRWRAGTFKAPAYLMLPLWFAWELFSARFLSAAAGSGVAHWAHVGGFVSGAVIALALRYTGLERKLDAAIESKVAVTADPRVLAAVEHLDHARPAEAAALLHQVLRDDPGHMDALLSLSRAAAALRDDPLLARTTAKLIERYWSLGEVDAALSLFEEPRPASVEALLPRDLTLRVARHHAATRHPAKAAALCARLRRDGLIDETAVRAALLEASSRLTLGDPKAARSLLAEAKESPFCTLELDALIASQTTKLDAADHARSLPS